MNCFDSDCRPDNLEILSQNLPIGLSFIDQDFRVLKTNPYFLSMLQMKAKDVVGKRCFEIQAEISGQKSDDGKQCFHCKVPSGEIQTFVNEINPDLILEFTLLPVKDDSGTITGTIELIQDITERIQCEKEIQEREKKYRTLLTNIPGMVYRGNPDWSVEIIKGAEGLCGYTRDELNAMPDGWLNIIHPDDRDTVVAEAADSFKEKQRVLIQTYRIMAKDKEIHWVEDHKVSLFSEQGKFIGVDGILFDITGRRQLALERQKFEANALAHAHLVSLGEIATGIAHELNQPLSYIKVLYEATLRDIEERRLDLKELQTDCTEALRQVSRIGTIIDHLRLFGRSDSKEYATVQLGAVLDNALILLNERLRLKNIHLSRQLADGLQPVFGNSSQLEQVFINLFQNSIYALHQQKDGRIHVSMRNEADRVVVRFSDNGPGVPIELQKKIFEPFFTTKTVGDGTGLGLSIVYGIVAEHQGTIVCESEPDQGVTFILSLPQRR
jgi:PAS domain S-box-containing protein